jgi:hypothetical protein
MGGDLSLHIELALQELKSIKNKKTALRGRNV